jgi:hypothetical protein
MIDWNQLLATILSNAVLLAFFAFLAKSFIERSLARNMERYKSALARAQFEHDSTFSLLHEKQAAVIADLYRLIVQLIRSMSLSAQGVHQYVDDQVATPREVRQAMSVDYLRKATADFSTFQKSLEENRIYLSKELLGKLTEFRDQLLDVLPDLEQSHQPTPPGYEGLPPSIKAIWDAQKKLRLLVQPLRIEVETEFRRILGVIDTQAET